MLDGAIANAEEAIIEGGCDSGLALGGVSGISYRHGDGFLGDCGGLGTRLEPKSM